MGVCRTEPARIHEEFARPVERGGTMGLGTLLLALALALGAAGFA